MEMGCGKLSYSNATAVHLNSDLFPALKATLCLCCFEHQYFFGLNNTLKTKKTE